MKRKDRSRTPEPEGPFNNAFEKLKSLASDLPPGPAPESATDTPPLSDRDSAARDSTARGSTAPSRAVIRLERKGHGGKEVTVLSHLEMSEQALGSLLSELKSTLGVGGRRKDDSLVFQGDQRERLRGVLTDRGVKRISVS